LEFGVVYEMVVCESVKSGVSDIKLTSVFCVGVYVTEVAFCID